MGANNRVPSARPRRSLAAIGAELKELEQLQAEVAAKTGGGFAAKMTARSLEVRRESLLCELRAVRANGTPSSAAASSIGARKQKSLR